MPREMSRGSRREENSHRSLIERPCHAMAAYRGIGSANGAAGCWGSQRGAASELLPPQGLKGQGEKVMFLGSSEDRSLGAATSGHCSVEGQCQRTAGKHEEGARDRTAAALSPAALCSPAAASHQAIPPVGHRPRLSL